MKIYKITQFKTIDNLCYYFKKEEKALQFIENQGEIESFNWTKYNKNGMPPDNHWECHKYFDPCKEKKSWRQYYRDKKYFLNTYIHTKNNDIFYIEEVEVIE